MTAPKKGKAGDSNGIRAEDIKTCDDKNERKDKTDLQRSATTRRLHPKGMAKVKNKIYLQKKVTWRKLEITAYLCITSIVQIVFNTSFQQTLFQA